MKIHTKIVNSSIECQSCSKMCNTPSLYMKHHQEVHGCFPPEYEDKEKYYCDQCPRVFIREENLTKHMSFHSECVNNSQKNNSSIECKNCSKMCKSSSLY